MVELVYTADLKPAEETHTGSMPVSRTKSLIMKLVQTELANGTRRLTTWLPYDKRIRVGSYISLDKLDTIWVVLNQHSVIESQEIKRGWNNNY